MKTKQEKNINLKLKSLRAINKNQNISIKDI